MRFPIRREEREARVLPQVTERERHVSHVGAFVVMQQQTPAACVRSIDPRSTQCMTGEHPISPAAREPPVQRTSVRETADGKVSDFNGNSDHREGEGDGVELTGRKGYVCVSVACMNAIFPLFKN